MLYSRAQVELVELIDNEERYLAQILTRQRTFLGKDEDRRTRYVRCLGWVGNNIVGRAETLGQATSRLVDQGNTVIVIEHNLDVIKTADWLIDLGPEGGSGGGSVLVEGTPEKVAATKKSYTGQFLRPLLGLE